MDLGPLRPYTWAVLLGLFVPLSWILEVMLGPAAIVFVAAGIALVMPALYALSTGASQDVALQEMSLGIAGILLVAYGLGLLFSLRTHRDIFNPVTEVVEEPRWTKRFALGVLVVSTTLVAVESELLVGSLASARTALGLKDLFIGVIIVAIVGNAAEHGSAVLMAWR